MSNTKRFGMLAAGLLVAAVLAVFATVVLRQADRSRADIPVIQPVPDFEFINQQGMAFGSADLIGKISVVDFIFTRCENACPIMAREMGELYRAFESTDDVQFVSISVDPSHDTLEVLQAYASANGVDDDRWTFLHAPIEKVVWLSEEGFLLPAENLPMGHSPRFALVDRQGQIRGYFNALEGKPMIALKQQIKQLLKEKHGSHGMVSSAHAAEMKSEVHAAKMDDKEGENCCEPGGE
ncbi:SCO family protein [bacterium]|nr:SCO family protein [bacterium]